MGLSSEKEQTTCYQCDTEIVANANAVHPLCDNCEQGFDDWFSKQLEIFR